MSYGVFWHGYYGTSFSYLFYCYCEQCCVTAVPCLLLAHSAFYCVRDTSKPHINKFLLCLTLLLGAWMSLFCFPPTSGIVCKKRMIRSVTAEYCISSFSAIIGKSKHNTAAHACISALSVFSAHFTLTLVFSRLVSFFPTSPCQLWCTLWYTHQFFVWITLLDALYSLLCIQLLAATASLLPVDEILHT